MRALVLAVMAMSGVPATVASSPRGVLASGIPEVSGSNALTIPVLTTPHPAVTQVEFYQEGTDCTRKGVRGSARQLPATGRGRFRERRALLQHR